MKRFRQVFMLACAISLSGCAFAPVVPPRGLLYNDQKAPLFGGRSAGPLVGEASSYSVMFLVGWGDSSIRAAAKNGGITRIQNVDYRLVHFLGLYQRFTVIVSGDHKPEANAPSSSASSSTSSSSSAEGGIGE